MKKRAEEVGIAKVRWRLVIGLVSLTLTVAVTAPLAVSRATGQPTSEIWPNGPSQVTYDVWPNAMTSEVWPNGILSDVWPNGPAFSTDGDTATASGA